MSRSPHISLPRKSDQSGISMIEVLVAILVGTVGLFSLMALQMTSVNNTHSSYLRSQASVLANTMMDQLRANETLALAGSYNISLGASVPTGTDVVALDLSGWRTDLGDALPSGTSSVTCTSATGICNVVIQWDDSRGTNGSSTQQFTLSARL